MSINKQVILPWKHFKSSFSIMLIFSLKTDVVTSQPDQHLNSSFNRTSTHFQRVFRRSQQREKSAPVVDSSCALSPTQVLRYHLCVASLINLTTIDFLSVRLDSSSSPYGVQSIGLGMIVCCGWDIFVVVETTSPLPKHQRHRNKKISETVIHR